MTASELDFAARVEAARPRLTAVVRRLVGADAEDVVQEAVLRAYLSLSQLRDAARFEPWLFCIAVNTAKMTLRRRRVELRAAAAGNLAPAVPADASAERELLELVRDAVALLPPAQRDAVLLHYVDGLSCDEVARLVGSSPGAVRVRLHRARAQLRRELAPLAPVPTPAEEAPMIEMKVEDVVVRVAADDPERLAWHGRIVVLREEGGERRLPIWTGAPEGDALAVRLRETSLPRPMSHDLMTELIRVVGARIDHVAVTGLRDNTFYATVFLVVDGRTEELDARPSDALALAVRTGAPILVEEGVLAEAGVAEDELTDKFESAEELPPGEWRSLSAELVRALHPPPRSPKR